MWESTLPVPAQPGNQWRLKQRAPAQQPASTPPTLQQPHQHQQQQQQSESSPGSQPQPNVVPEGAAVFGSTSSTSHGGPLSTHAQTLPVPRASMLPEDSRVLQASSPEIPPQPPPPRPSQHSQASLSTRPTPAAAALQRSMPSPEPRKGATPPLSMPSRPLPHATHPRVTHPQIPVTQRHRPMPRPTTRFLPVAVAVHTLSRAPPPAVA